MKKVFLIAFSLLISIPPTYANKINILPKKESGQTSKRLIKHINNQNLFTKEAIDIINKSNNTLHCKMLVNGFLEEHFDRLDTINLTAAIAPSEVQSVANDAGERALFLLGKIDNFCK